MSYTIVLKNDGKLAFFLNFKIKVKAIDYIGEIRSLLDENYPQINKRVKIILNELASLPDSSYLDDFRGKMILGLNNIYDDFYDTLKQISAKDKNIILQRCIKVALMNHELHCLLDEGIYADVWYKKAIQSLNEWLCFFRTAYGSFSFKEPNRISTEEYQNLADLSLSYVSAVPPSKLAEQNKAGNNTLLFYDIHDAEALYITDKGKQFYEQQISYVKHCTKNTLEYSVSYLQISDIEKKKIHLSRLAYEKCNDKDYLEAAKIKTYLANICEEQGKISDKFMLEESAYKLWKEGYNQALVYLKNNLKKQIKFVVDNIPNFKLQEELLNTLSDKALERKQYDAAAMAKKSLAKILAENGQQKDAYLLECSAKEYEAMSKQTI